jgi:hypothetical protein
MPMVRMAGRTEYPGRREATLTIWFGENAATINSFALTVQ